MRVICSAFRFYRLLIEVALTQAHFERFINQSSWKTLRIFSFFFFFPDHVPFKEFLVYPDSTQKVGPPEYIGKIKHPPDWEIIYKKEALAKFSREDVSPSNYSLTKDFEDLRLNISSSEAKPDETQLAAIAMALKHRVILIQVLVVFRILF